jgi:hypothetical protein
LLKETGGVVRAKDKVINRLVLKIDITFFRQLLDEEEAKLPCRRSLLLTDFYLQDFSLAVEPRLRGTPSVVSKELPISSVITYGV